MPKTENKKSNKRSGRRVKERIAMVSTHGYVAAEAPLGMPDTGGQVVYVLELSKKLAQLGYKVDIWTRRFEDQPEIEKVDTDVRIIRMPCGGKEFIPKEFLYKKLPAWGENALRFIKKKRLKYQFINSHYWDAGLAGQHLSEVLSVPHIHTPHSIGSWKKEQMETDYPDDKEALDKQYNFSRRVHHETILYRECDLLIATSPIQLDILRRDYDVSTDKMKMIPPGYDDNRFYPMSGASRDAVREDLGYKGKVVASIGRLAENKGFDLLVHAFSVVAAREPEAQLRLAVGTDPNNKLLKELKSLVAKLKLNNKVVIGSSLDDNEMPDFYRAADVFCLPSRYEPFGMTAIEAMACGTPTVITTHGGLYRTMKYGEDALYADSFDKEDYGLTILKALRFPAIHRRLSLQGAQKVRSLFTWTGIAQQLLGAVEDRSTQRWTLAD
ncbi:MAG: glycosyltransferase [Opitutales bacterium]|nr:glycosyltransferase [Opitutales bacterium]